MKLMRMPMFTWSVLITSLIILFAFPVLAVALAMLTIDRLFGAHFFTVAAGGMPMQWVNLFWIWGHPEVYIVILPAFGVLSEVVATFSSKRLFGYGAMVASMVAISVLSFLVWVHHFFTMGAGPGVNAFFGIATMAIAIPTGVKVFNWLLTMYKGRIRLTVPMLWATAFIPNFLIGGLTGVMLAVAPADYQYHNSYFLVSHFHYTLIGGTVFGVMSGLFYWWPKMFGTQLNERIGKHAFWWFMIGFNVCFLPQYLLGFMGMTRRMYTYPAGLGWGPWNLISTIGAFMQGMGFLLIVWNVVYSLRHPVRDLTGDPWNGRTLEWSLPSPAPEYNFARIPVVHDRDEFWEVKKGRVEAEYAEPLQPIHMPNSSGRPFILSFIFFVAGFALVFEIYWLAITALAGILLMMLWRSFEFDYYHHIPVDEVKETEAAWGRL